jgi:sugar fermentation stimulation protein A
MLPSFRLLQRQRKLMLSEQLYPLIGHFKKRYKRFFVDVDVELSDDTAAKCSRKILTAHLANTGSMRSCFGEDWPVALSYHPDKKRKLPYSVEMIKAPESWIGVNTTKANAIVQEAITSGFFKNFLPSGVLSSEPRWQLSESLSGRFDFAISLPSGDIIYIEVKSVTLKEENSRAASFPDAVTERGQKHLEALTLFKQQAPNLPHTMIYLIQREDVDFFQPAEKIDPVYTDLLRQARDAGVQLLALQCMVNPAIGIKPLRFLPIQL